MRLRVAMFAGVSLVSSATVLLPPAYGQTANRSQGEGATATDSGGGLADIVVTAQRRSESLQKVPIAVAVASSDQLKSSGVETVTNLKVALPGVDVQRSNGYAIPIIRGVGSKGVAPGLEPPVAFYVDGVYIANQTSTLLNFNNIKQIEVLKGPQGTLFGRNATAGLIQISTRDPGRELTGSLDLSYGNYDTFRATGYIAGGLGEGISADLAATVTTMGKGYGHNYLTGQDVYQVKHDVGLRSKWYFTPGDTTEVRLIFDYTDTKNSNGANRLPIGATAPAPYGPTYGGTVWDVTTDQPLVTMKAGGVSLRVDQEIGALRFASISAYRKSGTDITFDSDYTPVVARNIVLRQDDWQFSQELQLLSPTSSAIKWVAGAYYFEASSAYAPLNINFRGVAAIPTPTPTVLVRIADKHTTDSISAFGQVTAPIVAGLNATVGLRYTSEKRALIDGVQTSVFADGTQNPVTFADASKRFNKLTWRFALDYAFSNNVLGYISYNRGFKSGGFNAGALTIPVFRPEVLDAYEAGLKSTLLDRRLRLNLSGFYYDYKDVQVQRNVNGANGLYNSGPVKEYGFEGELEAEPIRGLNLRATYQFIPVARYTDFPAAVVAVPRAAGGYTLTTGSVTNNRTALSPRDTLGLTADYSFDLGSGNLGFNVSYYYNSGYYHEPDNVTRQDAYNLVNASIRYKSSHGWSASIWGNNLTNAIVTNLDGIQSFGATGIRRASYAPPRTYGVSLGYSF